MGECFFWYWPTRAVPDQRPLNGCVCVLFNQPSFLELITAGQSRNNHHLCFQRLFTGEQILSSSFFVSSSTCCKTDFYLME